MKRSISLLTVLTISSSIPSAVFAQVNEQDSLALVNLYSSTNGPSWKNHTNWLTTSPVSTWFGVMVDNGRVVRLELVITHHFINIYSQAWSDVLCRYNAYHSEGSIQHANSSLLIDEHQRL